jgi:carbamoyltransferase
MDDGPLVLGVNRTQDASLCLMRGSTLQWAIQKERLTRTKHHWGRLGDLRDYYAPRLPGLQQPIDVLVECYSSDAEIEKLAAYERELAETLTLAPHIQRARISHHVAHLYSVFHPSPFEQAAVMVIDGQGSAVADFTDAWSGAACARRLARSLLLLPRRPRARRCASASSCGTATMPPGRPGHVLFPADPGDFSRRRQRRQGDGAGAARRSPRAGLPPLDGRSGQVHMPAPWRDDAARTRTLPLRPARRQLFAIAPTWRRPASAPSRMPAGSGALAARARPASTALLCRRHRPELFGQRAPAARDPVPPGLHSAGAERRRHRPRLRLYGLTEAGRRALRLPLAHDYLGPAAGTADIEAALRTAT